MSSAQTKVIVRSFGDRLAWGYLPHGLAVREGRLELLDPAARVTPLDLAAIKWVAFVRDFNLDDRRSPERLDRRRFNARPRSEGLWVRLRFTDSDTLEGLVQFSRALLDSVSDTGGLFLTPPDPRGNSQRLFVPRHALDSLEALGLVLPPGAKAARPAKPGEPATVGQPTLFPADPTR